MKINTKFVKSKKAASAIIGIIILVVIIASIVFIAIKNIEEATSAIYKSDYFVVKALDNPDYYLLITVSSNSMMPAIVPNHNIVLAKEIEHYGISNITTGDIISFQRGDQVVLHRVTAIGIGSFQTQGDNNETPDADFVPFEDVKSVVVGIFWK
ncbi:MAG: S26 family signal peptidase [Actinobacteria bacterium]|nr:S26 family signal peptidase [Actinomycetota bacterium]